MSRLSKTISVEKLDNSVLFTFAQNQHYLYDGTIEVPFNSLSIIADKSEAITLRKSASNDIFISAPWQNFDITASSKEDVVDALVEMLYDEAGISQEEVQDMIDAATSGIPSSQVIEQLRTDVNTISGNVENNYYDKEYIDEKEEVVASALTQLNLRLNEDEEVTAAALNDLNDRIGSGGGALFVDFDDLMNNMNDDKWDELVNALQNNKPIFYSYHYSEGDAADAGQSPVDGYVYINQTEGEETTEISLKQLNGGGYYAVTIIKNGSEDYKVIDEGFGFQPMLQAGSGISIDENNVISVTVDSELDETSNNPVANSAVTNVIIDDEEVISRAINELNDRLVAVESGGSSVTVDTSLDSGSTNPVANSAITNAIDAKQDTLVSGTNIKTINNESILGSGNITISGGGGQSLVYYTEDTSNESATIMVQNDDGLGNRSERRVFVNGGDIIIESYNETDDGKGNTGTTDTQVDINSLGLSIITSSDDGINTNQTELEVQPMGAYINSEPIATEPYVDAALSGKADTSAVTAAIDAATSGKVDTSAITSAITSASTNDEVAGAKAVYDAIDAKADASTTYTKTEVNNIVNNKFWCGTQAQYDALATKENDVLYLIHE